MIIASPGDEVLLSVIPMLPFSDSLKTDVVFGTAEVYKVDGGVKTVVMASTPLIAIAGTGLWAINWDTTGNLPGDYVAQYSLFDVDGVAGNGAENIFLSVDAVVVSDTEFCRKMLGNKSEVISGKWVVYDDDEITVFRTFDLFDRLGNPTNLNPFKRDPI